MRIIFTYKLIIIYIVDPMQNYENVIARISLYTLLAVYDTLLEYWKCYWEEIF